ncbi:NAD-dependent SIR2 family protein deacetylase [Chryseobacterium ginsenosidimutans]|uniref:hypothetical protein n=1 Tax=Chryseobacterium ginsenosidimutans TaxID=687846 RepID=UPI002168051E|nr:hypothetical protein [Chryseobacterium ginsenosidimutans]MCS3868334.1 NAD-dependent SIR2 family protein deacetylase [Chryseobacterium ginsenosidimutans]
MEELQSILKTILKEKQGYITFLTGAGISAESGLPTYKSINGTCKLENMMEEI